MFQPKAQSVDCQGAPDDFTPACFYRPEVIPGGHARLAVSLPPERLAPVHQALVAALEGPLKLLYVQLTDRRTGQLPKPRQRVAIELDPAAVQQALHDLEGLIYRDGRHQLWLRGALGEQVVLDELGMVYVYPDDPVFREVLDGAGVPVGDGETMDARDYVRVSFDAAHDAQEDELSARFGLRDWQG